MNQSSNYQSGSVTQTITIPKSEPEPESKSPPPPNHTPFEPYTRQKAGKSDACLTASRKDDGALAQQETSDLFEERRPRRSRWGDSNSSTSEPVSEPTKEKTSPNPVIGFSMMRSSSSGKSEKKKSTINMPNKLPPPTQTDVSRYKAVTMGINPMEDKLLDEEIEALLAQRRSGQANVGNLNSANQNWKVSRLATEETGARSKRSESSNPSRGKKANSTTRSHPCVPVKKSRETKATKQSSVSVVPALPITSNLSTAIGNV